MAHIGEFHDGNLVGVYLDHDSCELAIIHGGIKHIVVCNALVKLRIDSFEEGNVIQDLYVHSDQSNTSAQDLDGLLWFVYAIDDNALARKPELSDFLIQKRLDVQLGKLSILEIVPSYGCSLVALAESIKIG